MSVTDTKKYRKSFYIFCRHHTMSCRCEKMLKSQFIAIDYIFLNLIENCCLNADPYFACFWCQQLLSVFDWQVSVTVTETRSEMSPARLLSLIPAVLWVLAVWSLVLSMTPNVLSARSAYLLRSSQCLEDPQMTKLTLGDEITNFEHACIESPSIFIALIKIIIWSRLYWT